MELEIWKHVNGYEGLYQISNFGLLKRLERNVIAKDGKRMTFPEITTFGATDRNGYRIASLCVNGKAKHFKIHRLVAFAFIPNAFNKPNINHINGITSDNRIRNIEWCNQSENNIHAYRVLGRACWFTGKPSLNRKKIIKKDKNGNIVAEYPSIIDGAKAMNGCSTSLYKALVGMRKTYKKFIWEYAK